MSFRRLSELTSEECDAIAILLRPDPILTFYWATAREDLARGIDNRLVLIGAGGQAAMIGAAFGDLTVFSPFGRVDDADLVACNTWPGAVEIHVPLQEAARYGQYFRQRLLRQREMMLMERDLADGSFVGLDCRVLDVGDADRVAVFYRRHYPETVFDPYMLAMPFVGAFDGDELISCGGTIAQSLGLRAALIGHFATAPAARNRGLARDVGNCLLAVLKKRGIATAYLATTADNKAALRVYDRLGFARVDRCCQIDLRP
jgi:ribosomal protein S18 acetylase RimI-like enzyme